MRFLFVKHALRWPRFSGHDQHSYHMMRALAALGHSVSLATATSPAPEAVEGLSLDASFGLGVSSEVPRAEVRLTGLQERFRTYWGIESSKLAALQHAVSVAGPDVVVAVGLDVLPYLAAARGAVRVWYAADEWFWHHASQLSFRAPGAWRQHLTQAVTKGLYERAFASSFDRVWVVSEIERRAMRVVAGSRTVDVIANGVDAEYFRPVEIAEQPRSAIFWGRLDFEPNVRALEWFCRRVWPLILRRIPDATFTIVGARPTPPIERLVRAHGVSLRANVADLRAEASRHAVVVLPFVSGAGIKNKLLEAASLARPIVCTPRACDGARGAIPVVRARTAAAWQEGLQSLWEDTGRRRQLGTAARAWVTTDHTWESAAQTAVDTLTAHIAARGTR